MFAHPIRRYKYTKCYCFACRKLRQQLYIQKVNSKINTCSLVITITLYTSLICLMLIRG